MNSFEFYVDTTPMADSVGQISNHIEATKDAVAVMQNSVITAEKEATEYICGNIDRSFYSLMRSQLSIKLSKHFTEMNSKVVLLNEFSKSLWTTKDRMEADVNRLKREYYKIFHGLDLALENRVFQLDQDAMKLSNIRKNLIVGRITKDSSNVFCYQKEVSETTSMTIAARMKNKASKALTCVGDNICENQSFRAKISKLFAKQPIKEKQDVCVPILMVKEQSTVIKGTDVSQLIFPEYMQKQTKDIIESKMMQQLEDLIEEPKTEQEKSEIKNEFYRMVADSGLDERTVSVINTLYENGGCR